MRIKTTRSNLVFLVPFAIYIFLEALRATEFAVAWWKPVQLVCLLTIIFKLCLDRYFAVRRLALWFVTAAGLVAVMVSSGHYVAIFAIVLFAFSSGNVDEKAILKCSLWTVLLVWIVTIVGAVIGIIPWNVVVQGTRVRYNLGFRYTTYSANIFMHLVIIWVYLHKKPKLIDVFVIMTANVLLFFATDTKVVFAEIMLLIFAWIFAGWINLKRKFWKVFFKSAFIWCALIALVFHIGYDASIPWMYELNNLVTHRLDLGYRAFQLYGITLFGQEVVWVTSDAQALGKAYFYVDSSFLNVLLNYGLVLFVLLVIGLTGVMKRSINRKNVHECVALLFVALHAITDPQLFNILYNPFLVLVGRSILKNNDFRKSIDVNNQFPQ